MTPLIIPAALAAIAIIANCIIYIYLEHLPAPLADLEISAQTATLRKNKRLRRSQRAKAAQAQAKARAEEKRRTLAQPRRFIKARVNRRPRSIAHTLGQKLKKHLEYEASVADIRAIFATA